VAKRQKRSETPPPPKPKGRVPKGTPPGRKCKLTPEAERIILDALRKGAFAHVAAAAAGIDDATLRRYLASDDERFKPFQAAYEVAKAGARIDAEARVFQDDPLAWLRLGPGRATDERPGWTDPPKRLEHSGPGGGPVAIAGTVAAAADPTILAEERELRKLAPEERRKVLSEARRLAGVPEPKAIAATEGGATP